MAESSETQDRLARMERDITEILNTQRYFLASNPNNPTHLEAIFTDREHSLEIFLALEGQALTQAEIMAKLHLSQGTVSKIVNYLSDSRMVTFQKRTATENEYTQSDVAKHTGAMRIAKRLLKK